MQANIENLDLKLDIRDKINAGWALVNANTALIASTGQRFATIQAAITAATAPATIVVFPGTYVEQVTLKNNVDLHLMAGATIEWNSATAGATIRDNDASVNCRILGDGIIKRTTATNNSPGVQLTGASDLMLQCLLVSASSSATFGISCMDGSIDADCDIESQGGGIQNLGPGTIRWRGRINCGSDYGIIVEAGVVEADGVVLSTGNSALGCYSSGRISFTGHAISNHLFGFEMGGGNAALRNAIIESTKAVAVEGSAISKYGGDELTLDNVILLCTHADAKSIETQTNETHGSIKVLTSSYANRAVQDTPVINFTYGETLLGIDT